MTQILVNSDGVVTSFSSNEIIAVLPASINSINLLQIGSNSFVSNTVTTTIDLRGTNIQRICQFAFQSCSFLQEVLLPNTITTIDSNSFVGTGITKIFIPASLQSIIGCSLNQMQNLVNITVSESNSKFCSINGSIFTKDKSKLIKARVDMMNENDLPCKDTLLRADAYAFTCSCMKTFTASRSLLEINQHTFHCMYEISTIDLSLSSITTIPAKCFWGSAMKHILLPTTCVELQSSAFLSSLIQYLIIPASVKTISANAFDDCKHLKRVFYQGSYDQTNAGVSRQTFPSLKVYVLDIYTFKTFGTIPVMKCDQCLINIHTCNHHQRSTRTLYFVTLIFIQ